MDCLWSRSCVYIRPDCHEELGRVKWIRIIYVKRIRLRVVLLALKLAGLDTFDR